MATTTTRRVEVWADQYSDVAAFAEEGDALNETFRRKGLCRMGTVEIEAVAPTWGTEQEVRQEVRRRVERALAARMSRGRTRIITTRDDLANWIDGMTDGWDRRTDADVEAMAETVRAMDHPRWGGDWSEFLEGLDLLALLPDDGEGE
jgi:hypothetical protein